jgi:hypothetical protein
MCSGDTLYRLFGRNMVSITSDPQNPEKLILSATVTLWLDKLLLTTLSEELQRIVREKAIEDLQAPAVQRELRRLATAHLAKLLGIDGQ